MVDASNGADRVRDSAPSARLSYKFQRLREQLRAAILGGQFSERLPGERELGKRFGANAKTINKALCDLAAEGLLVRRIGRGTYLAREGSTLAGVRRGCFFSLLPSGPGAPYRAAILDAVRAGLSIAGQVLEDRHAGPADSNVRLSDWPATARSSTAGLLLYPANTLDNPAGLPGADCLLEAHRRHVPVVVIGATGSELKLNSVCPDYADAGFRAAQHLQQRGCGGIQVLSVAAAGQGVELALTGVASGWNGEVNRIALDERDVAGSWALDVQVGRGGMAPWGLICIGRRAAESVARDAGLSRQIGGGLLVACILEPGDPAGEMLGLTSYEVDPQRMAQWTVRLLLEARSGQRPIQCVLPGILRVRRSTVPHSPSNGVVTAMRSGGDLSSQGVLLAGARR